MNRYNCKAWDRIEASRVYIGGGMTRHDAVHLTQAGLDAGWRYVYPHGISMNGVNVYDLGQTLDGLVAAGLADWHTTVETICG